MVRPSIKSMLKASSETHTFKARNTFILIVGIARSSGYFTVQPHESHGQAVAEQLWNIDIINHPHDDRLHGNLVIVQQQSRRSAFTVNEHEIMRPGTGFIHGDHGFAFRRDAIEINGLHEKEFVAAQMLVLNRCDHVADNTADKHIFKIERIVKIIGA